MKNNNKLSIKNIFKHFKSLFSVHSSKSDVLDSQEFYEIMQKYRHSPIGEQQSVVNSFEEVKQWIRNNY